MCPPTNSTKLLLAALCAPRAAERCTRWTASHGCWTRKRAGQLTDSLNLYWRRAPFVLCAALYTLDGEPWLLDARCGRPDDLVPTVFALWRLPGLLPAVPVRHAAVSHFLISELLRNRTAESCEKGNNLCCGGCCRRCPCGTPPSPTACSARHPQSWIVFMSTCGVAAGLLPAVSGNSHMAFLNVLP